MLSSVACRLFHAKPFMVCYSDDTPMIFISGFFNIIVSVHIVIEMMAPGSYHYVTHIIIISIYIYTKVVFSLQQANGSLVFNKPNIQVSS